MHRCVLHYSGPLEIDHINGDRTDNRKANLRLATKAQNAHNRKQHKGLKGVQQQRAKYVARIKLDKNTYLGSFDTADEAHAAYVAAANEHFGAYARAAQQRNRT